MGTIQLQYSFLWNHSNFISRNCWHSTIQEALGIIGQGLNLAQIWHCATLKSLPKMHCAISKLCRHLCNLEVVMSVFTVLRWCSLALMLLKLYPNYSPVLPYDPVLPCDDLAGLTSIFSISCVAVVFECLYLVIWILILELLPEKRVLWYQLWVGKTVPMFRLNASVFIRAKVLLPLFKPTYRCMAFFCSHPFNDNGHPLLSVLFRKVATKSSFD